VFVFVDFQAGLAFGVESTGRQTLVNNAVALARTAVAFGSPVVATTSASKVYSGPLLPALQSALPAVQTIERRNMNFWEDEAARQAVTSTGRERIILTGLLTEACVSFPALSALKDSFDVFVVADACGGLTVGRKQAGIAAHGIGGSNTDQLDFRCCWSFNETGHGTRRMKRHDQLSSTTEAVTE
jgi:nicotinamidase-related amidase